MSALETSQLADRSSPSSTRRIIPVLRARTELSRTFSKFFLGWSSFSCRRDLACQWKSHLLAEWTKGGFSSGMVEIGIWVSMN